MIQSKFVPLLVGGLAPALLYGLAGVLQKLIARQGGSVATYLVGFGLGTVLLGIVFGGLLRQPAHLDGRLLGALAAGAIFALGAGLISLTLIRYDAAISQLSPLYNMNVLVTVVLGLILFSEGANLSLVPLLLGTCLILAGGWLVSSA